MKQFSFQDDSPLWLRWLCFALLSAFYLWFKYTFHEGWKDEWQAWLMARDMGWGELTASLYYEGHPALWYYWLKLWTEMGSALNLDEWVTLQTAHSVVVLAAYGVFLLLFRLPLWLKVVLLLGYFPMFEYGLINRGYAWVMLLGFLTAYGLTRPTISPWVLGVLLFLLCQTEVYGVLIAGGLVLYQLLQANHLRELFHSIRTRWMLGGLLVGLVIFVITVFPRASQEELATAYLDNPFSGAVMMAALQGIFTKTYLPGLITTVKSTEITTLGLVSAGGVMLLLIYFFAAQRRLLITFGIFCLVFFAFCSLIYLGGMRQWGNHYIFFLLLLHLLAYHQAHLSVWRWLVLGLVVLFQLYYSWLGMKKEWLYPFSNAKKTAAFIQENIPPQVPIVAINKFEAAPVGGFAGRKFYALPTGEPFSYFKWVEKIYLPPQQELSLFREYKRAEGLLVLSPTPLDQARYPDLQRWQTFTDYNIKNENYYLYILRK